MAIRTFAGNLIFLLFSFAFANTNAASRENHVGKRLTEHSARRIAERTYAEATSSVVKKFKCRLSDQSPVNWYFVCKNLDEAPRLDTDGFVTIRKNGGAATISLGG